MDPNQLQSPGMFDKTKLDTLKLQPSTTVAVPEKVTAFPLKDLLSIINGALRGVKTLELQDVAEVDEAARSKMAATEDLMKGMLESKFD